MNLRTCFVAVWQGVVGKSELSQGKEQATEAGITVGKALAGAWAEGVREGFSEELSSSVTLLLGSEEEAGELIEEAEIVSKSVDFSRMTKKQLREYADQHEILLDGRWSEESMREALAECET